MTLMHRYTLAEWLRRRPAKPMGSPRVGSNPTGVVFANVSWPGGPHQRNLAVPACDPYSPGRGNPGKKRAAEHHQTLLGCRLGQKNEAAPACEPFKGGAKGARPVPGWGGHSRHCMEQPGHTTYTLKTYARGWGAPAPMYGGCGFTL